VEVCVACRDGWELDIADPTIASPSTSVGRSPMGCRRGPEITEGVTDGNLYEQISVGSGYCES